MCIFAGPVESVGNTRIACFNLNSKRFTAYQMEVGLQRGKGNAMILAVPALDSKVDLVDMSTCENFFDLLEEFWPVMRSRGIVKFLGEERGYLPVHKVGSYEVSIAKSVDEIKMVDPSVFTLSEATEGVLRTSYPKGYTFIVAKLTKGGKIHPLGYTYESWAADELFLPAKHEHGDGEEHMAYWDHTLYFGSDVSSTLESPQNLSRLKFSAFLGNKFLSLAKPLPALTPFANGVSTLAKITFIGHLPNVDVRFALSS